MSTREGYHQDPKLANFRVLIGLSCLSRIGGRMILDRRANFKPGTGAGPFGEGFSMRQFRLRALIWAFVLVDCLVMGVGCSATSGSRFRSAAGSQSIASVGDQPVPPAVGASGEQVAADVPEPEPYRNPKSRISGRVVDSQGRAVAGAAVRLADGSSKAGRDAQTTTDAAGGFTLGGLRPGSGYTLVAEANFGDRQGTITGRTQANTADTGVQIRLGDSTDDPIPPPAKRGLTKTKTSRAQPISERVDGEFKPASQSDVNAEDLGPPVESADVVANLPPASPGVGRPRPKQSATSSRWHRLGADVDSKTRPELIEAAEPTPTEPPDTAPELDLGAGSARSRSPQPAELDDVNPLPPSLPARKSTRKDAVGASASNDRSPRLPVSPDPDRAADPSAAGQLFLGSEPPPESAGPSGPTDGLLAMPTLPGPGESGLVAQATVPPSLDIGGVASLHEPPPDQPITNGPGLMTATNPAPLAPGDSVSSEPPPESSAPDDPSAGYNPFATVPTVPPEPVRTAMIEPAAPPVRFPRAAPEQSPRPTADPAATTGAEVAADPAPKPQKWGDLASVAPLAAGASLAASALRTGGKSASTVSAPAATRPSALLARRSRATPAKPDAPALCQFGSQSDLLIDFQLPDLDGSPVRFRDFDSDFVLLDFWGTWCGECVGSIPHLVDLQKQYGPNKLKVVGIACEKTPVDKRKALVAAAADRLGINYSVLVATLDGTDPVQRDLQVRVYPTMILLDRRGKVLFRAEGGTESNLFRLDKALAAASRSTQTARR